MTVWTWLDSNWLGAIIITILAILVFFVLTNVVVTVAEAIKKRVGSKATEREKRAHVQLTDAECRLTKVRANGAPTLIPLVKAETDHVKAKTEELGEQRQLMDSAAKHGFEFNPRNKPDWLEDTYKESPDEDDDKS